MIDCLLTDHEPSASVRRMTSLGVDLWVKQVADVAVAPAESSQSGLLMSPLSGGRPNNEAG